METLTVKLKSLVPVWTGGIDRSSEKAKETGLAGSIRWWYEALVRGLDGYACAPTSDDRCIFDAAEYARTGQVEDGLKDVCFVCRLFGCTGWSSKFRFQIANGNGKVGEIDLNRSGVDFSMNFVGQKPILNQEKWLLSKVFWLVDEYGSIGGRTTQKPPDRPDYGIVEVTENIPDTGLSRDDIEGWIDDITENSEVMDKKLEMLPVEYPDLLNFFFNTGKWLSRRDMNQLVQIDRSKFLAGQRGVSKKVFSFKDVRRFWGYTTGEEMLELVMNKLGSMRISGTKKGDEILNEL